MKQRRVAVFSGNRAEYGLQKHIWKVLKSEPKIDLKIIVSGAHIKKDWGKTLNEIIMDGFEISQIAKYVVPKNERMYTSLSISRIIESVTELLEKINPDIFIVYADRFETFAATIASTQMGIPTFHIEGGDITNGGTFDDSVRHAISKLSHMHFPTNTQAATRLLQMGEQPNRVHVIGIGLNQVMESKNYASKEELERFLKVKINKPILLLTQHPISSDPINSKNAIAPTVEAVTKLLQKEILVIATYPNDDIGSRTISECLQSIKSKNFVMVKSLGSYYFHGILALHLNGLNNVCVLGNSSAGIKETPFFKCPTVNVGSRQDSRLKAKNVIDVKYDSDEIFNACLTSLFDSNFQKIVRESANPYESNINAGVYIRDMCLKIELGQELVQKKFNDRWIVE